VLSLLSHSFVAWQFQVANLQRGVRHGGQGWKFHSCLWLWGGKVTYAYFLSPKNETLLLQLVLAF